MNLILVTHNGRASSISLQLIDDLFNIHNIPNSKMQIHVLEKHGHGIPNQNVN